MGALPRFGFALLLLLLGALQLVRAYGTETEVVDDGVDMSTQENLPEMVDSELAGALKRRRKPQRPRSSRRKGQAQSDQRLRSLVDRLLVMLDEQEGLSRKKRQVTCPATAKYRTIDGSCNNVQNSAWGQANQPFKRLIEQPAYDGGVNIPRRKGSNGLGLTNSRAISRTVSVDRNKPYQVAGYTYQWGQFLDHDVTGSTVQDTSETCCTAEAIAAQGNHPDVEAGGPCFPIVFDSGDARFTSSCLEFRRSAPADANGVWQQVNELTGFIDASNVYGSDSTTANGLREFSGGRLKVETGNKLPRATQETCLLENADDYCQAAGDARVNVVPGLAMLHTVFHREHNQLADSLAALNPSWSDEQIYQEARKIVGALMQHITYAEFLPNIIPQDVLTQHRLDVGTTYKYEPERNPTISNEFATAAFRFGHSIFPNTILVDGTSIPLEQVFLRPSLALNNLTGLATGLLRHATQTADRYVADGLTNHLFETSTSAGSDLVALNIQRGRDHGLPPFNSYRELCGLTRVDIFNHEAFGGRNPFREVYNHVDDIDLFPGLLMESHTDAEIVGPTLACLLARQFEDLKFGDSFWYETDDADRGFSQAQLAQIKSQSLAHVLCRNLEDLRRSQPRAFELPTSTGDVAGPQTRSGDRRRPSSRRQSRSTEPNDMTSCQNFANIDLSAWKQA